MVANKTLRSDLLALRQVLKYAKREEWITAIPDFPKLTVTPRPGGWFTREEIIKLFVFTQPWIRQADISGVERRKRAYAYYYMQWLVFMGMRVDEALQVRYEDVTILRAKPPKQTRDCLFVKVKGGKLSYLTGATEMIGLVGADGAQPRVSAIRTL